MTNCGSAENVFILFSQRHTHAFGAWLCEVHRAAQAQEDWHFPFDLLAQQVIQCVPGLGPSFEACFSPEARSVGSFARKRQSKEVCKLRSDSKPDSGLFRVAGNDPMD